MKSVRLLAVVVAVAVIGSACSGDSVEEAILEEAQTQATAGGGTDASAADEGVTETIDEGATETIGTIPDTAIGDIPGVSGECEALANLMLGMSQIFLGGDANNLLAAAQSDLPSSLDGELETILDAVQQYADILGELDIDFSDPTSFASLSEEQIAAFDEASGALDTDEVNAAFDAVSAYGEAECAEFIPGG